MEDAVSHPVEDAVSVARGMFDAHARTRDGTDAGHVAHWAVVADNRCTAIVPARRLRVPALVVAIFTGRGGKEAVPAQAYAGP